MSLPKILVVDDDLALRHTISRFLSQKDYQVELAEDGQTALATFKRFNPDLVILDTTLPDVTGYDLCLEMQSGTGVFVIMMTSRTDEADKIRGFTKGADDYITKPFSLGELGVRVAAILKRHRPVTAELPPRLVYRQLVIDLTRREVTLANRKVSLTALEFDILYFLAKNPRPGRRSIEIIQEIWDCDYVGDSSVLDKYIKKFNELFGDDYF